jgi:HAD superfamily hydrolase (TIGR01549 family)
MNLKNKTVILWDFDGVILNSNSIRDVGFTKTLENFPKKQVDALMKYHHENGGLSRYAKFRYFFEEIRNETVSNNEILEYASKFSEIMLNQLIDPSLIIQDALTFVKNNFENKEMHIVSASDQKELRMICKGLDLVQYFHSISGSPTTKIDNVSMIIENNRYRKETVVLIGDSINDYNAATKNGISFIGYNNLNLKTKVSHYIARFNDISS